MARALRPNVRFACALVTCGGLQLVWVASLYGQPWVPPKGEGTVSLTYQNYYVTGHFDVDGNRNTNGATHTKALAAELDYGLTDTVGISISLPFIGSKYTGPPFYFVAGRLTLPGPLDDGSYHGAFQDFRVELRRLFLAGPVAIAPFLGGSVPTHGYETVGEAVPGRRRREFQAGASVGAALNPILPGAYAHARYSLAVAEVVSGFPAVRSNVDLEAGGDIISRLALKGLASWQIKHKGPQAFELFDDWLNHDRFIVGSFFTLGAGMALSLTHSTEVHATWIATLSGKGGGHIARLFAVGMTWSFGDAFEGFGATNAQRTQRE